MKKILLIVAALVCTIGATAQNNTNMKTDKLVVYFSCTGTTKGAAEKLAQLIGADLYEITPAKAYSDADLDWRDKKSRSTIEMNDLTSRPAIKGKCEKMHQYKTVYVGFPIWWNLAPTIINTFMESYDFTGKTIIPFATSGGSSIDNSEKSLRKSYTKYTWKTGKLINGSVNKSTLAGWIE